MGSKSSDHPNDRLNFGRTRQVTAHLDHAVLNNLNYEPPPGPDRTWKKGETLPPRFSLKDVGRALMFPRRNSDVTTLHKREQRNCSVLGNDDDASAPRGITDVTDILAYERRREKIAQPLVGRNLNAGTTSSVNTGGGVFWAVTDHAARAGVGVGGNSAGGLYQQSIY
jgi:hypothetical protein